MVHSYALLWALFVVTSALPWDGPKTTNSYAATADWSPRPTGRPDSNLSVLELFRRADQYPVSLCGWIGGAQSVPAYCSSSSSCVWNSAISYVGCCAFTGGCVFYTDCIDGNDPAPTESLPHVYTCSSTSVCYRNTYPNNYYQWGCGASNLATFIATSFSGQVVNVGASLAPVVFTGADALGLTTTIPNTPVSTTTQATTFVSSTLVTTASQTATVVSTSLVSNTAVPTTPVPSIAVPSSSFLPSSVAAIDTSTTTSSTPSSAEIAFSTTLTTPDVISSSQTYIMTTSRAPITTSRYLSQIISTIQTSDPASSSLATQTTISESPQLSMSSSSSTLSSTSQSPSSATIISSMGDTSAPISNGISTGAKAGIGVGAGFAGLAAACLCVYFCCGGAAWMKSRKSRKSAAGGYDPQHPDPYSEELAGDAYYSEAKGSAPVPYDSRRIQHQQAYDPYNYHVQSSPVARDTLLNSSNSQSPTHSDSATIAEGNTSGADPSTPITTSNLPYSPNWSTHPYRNMPSIPSLAMSRIEMGSSGSPSISNYGVQERYSGHSHDQSSGLLGGFGTQVGVDGQRRHDVAELDNTL